MPWTYEYDFTLKLTNAAITSHSKTPRRNASSAKERYQRIGLTLSKDYVHPENDDEIYETEDCERCSLILSADGFLLRDDDTGEEYNLDLPLSTYYKRANGKDKVLNSFPSGSLKDPNVTLLDYDWLFAIDTNTKSQLSVTAIAQCFSHHSESSYSGMICVTCNKWDSSLFPKPEIQAWAVLVDEIIRQKPHQWRSKKTAIIVDSELGLLSEYNAQLRPLATNFYLPSNFTLIYASADSGSEFLSNQLIQLCDKHAAQILKSL